MTVEANSGTRDTARGAVAEAGRETAGRVRRSRRDPPRDDTAHSLPRRDASLR
ncbi:MULTISPECIES: hypothetical protein [Streptomyces]|uniref:hypothetical protein n=1 Tax=Streptomyces TaxID=1883 RepID=UPI000A5F78B5|nr:MULTISPECIES: hypothetical protein [Streptomyces]